MIEAWHCDFTNDGGTPPTLTGQDCVVTASSTIEVASSTASTTPYTYHDWIFVNMVIIFLLGLMALRLIFAPLRS